MDHEPAAPVRRRNVLETAQAWLGAGRTVALATVVSTWGSAPVPVGGQLVVASDGRFEGAVSGGCVEADVIAEAADILAGGPPKLLAYGVENETAWRVGLPCGGRIRILLQPLTASDAPVLAAIATARACRRRVVVATRLSDGHCTIRTPADPTVSDTAGAASSDAHGDRVVETDGDTIVHVLAPAPRLVIVGANAIAQHLVRLSEIVRFDAVVVDPRSAFASSQRFAGAHVIGGWPADELPRLRLDALTGVAVLAHAEHIDDDALKFALASPAGYVGALGSRRSHARRIERLSAAGVPAEDLARIRAPIGLAIGAQGPAQIALAIMAEVVAVMNGTASP